jgi:hypothetical protein
MDDIDAAVLLFVQANRSPKPEWMDEREEIFQVDA